MINLDFSNVQTREPIPAGSYSVTVDKAEEKTSSKGNPMIVITFAVTEEPYTARKLFYNLVLMDSVLWKVKEFFEAIGMDADGALECEVSDLVGLNCVAIVTQEEYNGSMTNRVTGVKPE